MTEGSRIHFSYDGKHKVMFSENKLKKLREKKRSLFRVRTGINYIEVFVKVGFFPFLHS